MKKIYDHTENDRPVMNILIIGLYVVALIGMLSILFRRFIPVVETAFDNFIAF